MGYLFAVTLEFLANVHLYCFFADLAAYAIGGFIFFLALIEDVKNHFDSINGKDATKATPTEFHKEIARSVELHAHTKEFSEMKIKFWTR